MRATKTARHNMLCEGNCTSTRPTAMPTVCLGFSAESLAMNVEAGFGGVCIYALSCRASDTSCEAHVARGTDDVKASIGRSRHEWFGRATRGLANLTGSWTWSIPSIFGGGACLYVYVGLICITNAWFRNVTDSNAAAEKFQ